MKMKALRFTPDDGVEVVVGVVAAAVDGGDGELEEAVVGAPCLVAREDTRNVDEPGGLDSFHILAEAAGAHHIDEALRGPAAACDVEEVDRCCSSRQVAGSEVCR